MKKSSKAMTEQGQRMSKILEVSREFSVAQLGLNSQSLKSEAADDDEFSTTSSRDQSTNSGGTQTKHREIRPAIAAKENLRVKYTKFLVFLVLLAAAATVGYLTYRYITNEEEDDYKVQFQTDAKELIDASNSNGRNIVAVLTMFSTLLSSTAIHDNATWPFHTLPDFEKFGQGSRELSGALLLAFSPIVEAADRAEWEQYSTDNQWWIQDGLEDLGVEDRRVRNITDFIYRKTTRSFVPEGDLEAYNPIWQLSPAPKDTSIVNFNLINHPTFKRLVGFSSFAREAAISEVLDTFLVFGNSAPQQGDDPQSLIVLPVFEIPNDSNSEIVGHLVAVIPWGEFFTDILRDGSNGVYTVLRESCGGSFTYSVNGPDAEFLGTEDLHDERYSSEVQSTDFIAYSGDLTGLDGEQDHCEYSISVYPSKEYEQAYQSTDPIVFTVGVICVFLFTSLVFVLYDSFVTQRQEKVNNVAVQSSAIVTSLFPEQVRDKLFKMEEEKVRVKEQEKNRFQRKTNISSAAAAAGLDADDDAESPAQADETAPIADLFPSATVLFMDIAGFTAWSSQREPSQVFILLETIYGCFDKLAKKRRVFKVETIGDCYVAVCGLPEPCEEHAVVMARFVRDCLEEMVELMHNLESTLGPDTADLVMRAGMHSGAVTAGVLRGERARFQLFGDTVNTASRMESTGVKAKIQVSQETAELIAAAGKSNWVVPRSDVVTAKGKGDMKTFWLLPRKQTARSHYTATSYAESDLNGSVTTISEEDSASPVEIVDQKQMLEARTARLVEYSSDILLKILKKILTKRGRNNPSQEERNEIRMVESEMGKHSIALSEVVEVIDLPKYEQDAKQKTKIRVSDEVRKQLLDFVGRMAAMYETNPFHNFDHASHVTQSVSKLLSRIIAFKGVEEGRELHDRTYGIASDPLTQFAIVFSSLIHDVDHRGVPNAILAKEEPDMASLYMNQAVAEQNSVDVAWNLLMDPEYELLRGAIYQNAEGLKRFRQLVVNSIMATDIFDKQLASLRKERWSRAFGGELEEDPQVAMNRKATIVIEHIIQASDVSHTMQHWYVYSKWNSNLYHEMLKAFCEGRSATDPTEGWYKGELWFFDNYVIPLAKKLKECGVFGVSSDEYLQYAVANRKEWETKGETLVQDKREEFLQILPERVNKQ